MDTDKLNLLASAIDSTLQQGKKITLKEVSYFSDEEELPEQLKQEIYIRARLFNEDECKGIRFLVKEIFGVVDNVPNNPPADFGNPILYKKIKKELKLDSVKYCKSAADKLHLKGDSRTKYFLDILRGRKNYESFTKDDADKLRHLDLLLTTQRNNFQKIHSHHREAWQKEKYNIQLSGIKKEYDKATTELQESITVITPAFIREVNKNVLVAVDLTQKIKIIDYYYNEIESKVNSILSDKQIRAIMDIDVIKGKTTDANRVWQLYEYDKAHLDFITSGDALADINVKNKKESHFFYLFIAYSIYTVLGPISVMKADLEKQVKGKVAEPPPEQATETPQHWAYYYYFLIEAKEDNGFNSGEKIKWIKTVCESHSIDFTNFQKQFNKVYHNKKGKEYRERGTIYNIELLKKICDMLKNKPNALKIANEALNSATNGKE